MASPPHHFSHTNTCFFYNLLCQPQIKMANQLIHVEDIASIARAMVAAENALLATLDTATAIANATAMAEEVMLASPETNITINNDEQGNQILDAGNVALGVIRCGG
jgi:hypothetical protein